LSGDNTNSIEAPLLCQINFGKAKINFVGKQKTPMVKHERPENIKFTKQSLVDTIKHKDACKIDIDRHGNAIIHCKTNLGVFPLVFCPPGDSDVEKQESVEKLINRAKDQGIPVYRARNMYEACDGDRNRGKPGCGDW
jgi:hypothetical protein